MTQTSSRLFDEIARLITNAAGAADSVREEVDALFRAQAERILNDLDMVPREDFEAVREMAVKARLENEELAGRLDALEKMIKAGQPKRPAPKKTKPKSK